MKSFLGIDIGSYSIKLIELRKHKNKYVLVSLGEMPIPPGFLSFENKEALNALSVYLKKVMNDSKCTTRNTISLVPSEKVFTTFITVPQMTEEELKNAMEWEIKKLPIDVKENLVNWQITEKNQQGMEILVVSTPKLLVSNYLTLLKDSGLNPVSLKLEPLALAKSLTSEGHKDLLVVHVGYSFTSLTLISKGNLKFIRNLRFGESSMITSLASTLKIVQEDAKQVLHGAGFLKYKDNQQVYNCLKTIINMIISETERTFNFFEANTRIILSGGCANIPGLINAFTEKIGKQTYLANPWADIDCSAIRDPGHLTKLGPRFAVAIGLAMT